MNKIYSKKRIKIEVLWLETSIIGLDFTRESNFVALDLRLEAYITTESTDFLLEITNSDFDKVLLKATCLI